MLVVPPSVGPQIAEANSAGVGNALRSALSTEKGGCLSTEMERYGSRSAGPYCCSQENVSKTLASV
jgi:hypothetical protein